MRNIFTLLLLGSVAFPTVTCAEPATQTQTAVETVTLTQASAADPAELLRNGKAPVDGVLTGGQPTPDQLKTLAELGYSTVINLRGPGEPGSTDPALVRSLGMEYVSIPISGGGDVNAENARRLAAAIEASDGPTVVHCASGNRVGALFALKAYHVDGKSPEEALELGKDAGVTRLEPIVRQQLGLE